jgi:hypothetical protein
LTDPRVTLEGFSFRKEHKMKRHLSLIIVMLSLVLSSCVPAANVQEIAERQLRALEPCIGIVVLRQNLTDFQACAFEAVKEQASSELAYAIDTYVSAAKPNVKYALLALFEVKTTKELGFLIVDWINQQLPNPPSLEDALYSVLGMARAQETVLEPMPKELKDIKELFSPEMVTLLLSLLTVPLTRLLKKTFNTDGYETIFVNALLKILSTGITMGLAGGATIPYIVVWVLISIAADQATYWLAVRPEKK